VVQLLMSFLMVVEYTLDKEHYHIATTEATACDIKRVEICVTGVKLACIWMFIQLHRLIRVLGLPALLSGCFS